MTTIDALRYLVYHSGMRIKDTQKKHRLLVHIDESQYEQLQTIKEDTGATIGEIVRRMLSKCLAERAEGEKQ